MYYAKPMENEKGLYKYHVDTAYQVMESELNQMLESITPLLHQCKETPEQYKEKMKIAMVMHDFGKLNMNFQKVMELLMKGKNVRVEYYFRHELLSFYYMIPFVSRWQQQKGDFAYPLFAVLSHHKSMSPRFESFQREFDKDQWPLLTEKAKEYGYSLLNDYDLPIPQKITSNQIPPLKIYMENFFSLVNMEKRGLFQFSTRYQIRLLYGIAKGQLQYCDWVASSEKDFPRYTLTQEGLIQGLKAKLEKDNRIYEERPFHKQCAQATGDVIAIAPTGSGKTEASLLWAAQFNAKKIIFCMPTKVTSNSIYERMRQHYFNPTVCGLSHSGTNTYFALQEEDAIPPFSLIHGKAFFPSVMVSTVDQILTSGFNSKLWSVKEYALVNSAVIFDEIQSYDTFTLALITQTIRKIKDLGGRVMLMSATFPYFLRKHFEKELGIDTPIIAEELMDRKSNQWRYIDQDLDGIREEIRKYLEQGKKVALIVNDVETSKREYDYWHREYATLCLHSEFMMKDRIEKEAILLDGSEDYQFIIATQVLEVSLDVSFEIMFSECAPIESLVQRAGRCNRHGKYEDSEFVVFNPSEISTKYVYKKANLVLEKTKKILQANQKRLSEKEILVMIEEVYEGFDIYDENYKEGEQLYQNIVDNTFIFDLPVDEKTATRCFEIEKMSIIPVEAKAIVEELFEQKEYAKIPLYEIPINYFKYTKIINTRIDNQYSLPIYCVDYSKEKGIAYDDSPYQML